MFEFELSRRLETDSTSRVKLAKMLACRAEPDYVAENYIASGLAFVAVIVAVTGRELNAWCAAIHRVLLSMRWFPF